MVGYRFIAAGIFLALLGSIAALPIGSMGAASSSKENTLNEVLMGQYCNPNVDPNCNTSS